MIPPQRMSQNPEPVKAGETTTISYAVDKDTTFPIQLVLKLSPSNDVWVVTIGGAEQTTFELEVPGDCQGIIINDSTGQSQDFAVLITT